MLLHGSPSLTVHWQESDTPPSAAAPDVVDVRYRIRCKALPVDHARDLRSALLEVWPWLADEPFAGIHTIHGAESGNGWLRPEDPRTYLPLSKRTRLALRLPCHRLEEAQGLSGITLQVGPDPLVIEDNHLHPLQAQGTVFARYVAIENEDEEEFLALCAEQLKEIGIEAPRMMTGRRHLVAGGEAAWHCRSLMLDGLDPDQSVDLQRQGLGPERLLGCGLFLPHKSIAPVARSPK